MAVSLLDTDTLSEVLKERDPTVMQRSRDYLVLHGHFTFSIITRYEVLRGLEAKQATKQISTFDLFCQVSSILPLTDEIVIGAAKIYGDLKRRGQLVSDSDILIASTALAHRLVLVTNNVAHFSRIPGLDVENWKTS